MQTGLPWLVYRAFSEAASAGLSRPFHLVRLYDWISCWIGCRLIGVDPQEKVSLGLSLVPSNVPNGFRGLDRYFCSGGQSH
jgi:hypothetical protein